jgi:hypothetical protein
MARARRAQPRGLVPLTPNPGGSFDDKIESERKKSGTISPTKTSGLSPWACTGGHFPSPEGSDVSLVNPKEPAAAILPRSSPTPAP